MNSCCLRRISTLDMRGIPPYKFYNIFPETVVHESYVGNFIRMQTSFFVASAEAGTSMNQLVMVSSERCCNKKE